MVSDDNKAMIDALEHIAMSLSSVKTIPELADAMEEIIHSLVEVEYSGLFFFDQQEENLKLLFAKGFSEEERVEAERTALERHPGEVFRTQKMLHVPDTLAEPKVSKSSPRSFVVRSRLFLPIMHRGDCLGCFGMGSTIPHAFSEKHIHVLQFVGNLVGVIHQNIQAQLTFQKINRLKSIGLLAGGIAHDFNNILMGLYGNISLAKMELEEGHPAYELLGDAEKSMGRATTLTKQLLTFAKGGAPVKESLKLGDVLTELIQNELPEDIEVIFSQEDELWLAEVDRGQIRQVFSNLFQNSVQAMSDGGRLFVSLENCEIQEQSLQSVEQGRYIKAIVRDEGEGTPENQLAQIYDPYFTTREGGSGLGLATVHSIVYRHKGHITVDSELGKETTFTLFLPASEEQKSLEIQAVQIGTTEFLSAPRILVMDDEATIRRVIQQMLERKNYRVETAESGNKAIDMYQRALEEGTPFDLVIMDLTIPNGMGGKEAIKHILQLDPEAKAIVSSGYADDPVMANYANYGFKGVVTKPHIHQLLPVLHRVLEH